MSINPMLQKERNDKKQMNDLYLLANPIDTENKIIIDIKDVINFCFCNKYYEYTKRKNEINFKQLYNLSLHQTFYNYLYALQNDRLENTLEFLKYQWGKEWIKYKKKSVQDILITSSSMDRDTYESKRKKGIDAIFTFNELMLKDKQYPIIIGHKYEFEILPNIILTGTLEYVRELTVKQDKIIQVVKFISETNRFTTNISKQYDIELIAMSYVFKELFNVKYFQAVSMDIDTKKISVQHYTEKEYNILKETIRNVVICIQNNIRYISPNKQCFHCEYRNICINDI